MTEPFRARLGRRVGDTTFHAFLLLATGAALLVTIARRGAGRLSVDFVASYPSRRPTEAGVKAALFGSLWLVGLTFALAVPVSVGAAVYLEEIAPRNRLTRLIEVNLANLAAIPSVIYGMLALGVFARALGLGFSLWTGAIALSLLVSPVVVLSAREAIRAVPPSVRHAAYALGATPLQVTRRAVLPPAASGILTGNILALSRALGEAAPLLLLGALVFSASTPASPSERFTALPIQIYNWVSRPQAAFQVTAAAGILVLLGILLTLNGVAVAIRQRSEVKW